MAGQESFTLYKKSAIEGYLDKINTGITSKWLSGKTRTWCELYGTVLYMFKDSKRVSAGSQQIDMSQVHMVRKITNEKSGVQFEINTKNKQHTFCASTVVECDNWIRQLQAAMTLKDQETPSDQKGAVFFVRDYETIPVSPKEESCTPQTDKKGTSTADPGYSEMEFDPPHSPSAQASGAAGPASASGQDAELEGDSGYDTVEFRRSRGSQSVKKSGDCDIPAPPTSQPPAVRPVVEEDSYGYVKVEMRKKSVSEVPPPCEPARKEVESKTEDSYGYATVQRAKPPGAGACNQEDSAEVRADGMAEESSEEDEILIATAQKNPDPIPPYPHPLTPADLEPLAALQEFLSSNRKLCRPSFSDKAMTENPVEDMKRLLEGLCVDFEMIRPPCV